MHEFRIYLLLAIVACSCQNESSGGYPSSPGHVRINTFTRDKIEDQYFWADEVRGKTIDMDSSMLALYPEIFFHKMLYAGDRWSSIVRQGGTPVMDAVANINDYSNNFGYNLAWGDAGTFVVAKVNLVFPGTPAAKAGLKRGDFITRVNGGIIRMNNTTLLTNSSIVKLGIAARWDQEKPDTTITLVARRNKIDPVFIHKTIFHGDARIGYVLYTDFEHTTAESLHHLDTLFRGFKTQKINEFILDLRYNGGGYIDAARHLCSLLAPTNVVEHEEVIIKKTWNTAYQHRYEKEKDSSQLEERFDKNIPSDARLGLDRLWVITSKATASASEVLISGLSPYMNVQIIGEKTLGKNMGGITFTPEDRDINDWHITLITLEFLNSRGESVRDGIFPHHPAEEDFQHYLPLGEKDDPLLQAVLHCIAEQATSRAARVKGEQPGIVTFVPGNPVLLFKK